MKIKRWYKRAKKKWFYKNVHRFSIQKGKKHSIGGKWAEITYLDGSHTCEYQGNGNQEVFHCRSAGAIWEQFFEGHKLSCLQRLSFWWERKENFNTNGS